MASVKVKFRPSSVAGREGTIYYQVLHDRTPRQFTTGYHIFPSEWDEKRSIVRASVKDERRAYVMTVRDRVRWDVERLTKIIRDLEYMDCPYTTEDVIAEFSRYVNESTVFTYMQRVIVQLKQNGKVRTSETYTATLNSFKKFRGGEDISLDCVSVNVMSDYESWLRARGVKDNTISFKERH